MNRATPSTNFTSDIGQARIVEEKMGEEKTSGLKAGESTSKTTATKTIQTLTSIWQRVLRLPSVGVEDNFFDLGGDSALALELFNEIAVACGRDLPPVVIYQAPTIAALAAILGQFAGFSVAPVVTLKSGLDGRLKEGTEAAPIFIAHGLGGSALDFYQVVKHIRTQRAIFGLQARGMEGAETPLDRIEDRASYALQAVRTLQPHGPYFLIGFSLGGLVALEMAQQLLAHGERVALLAMLDSYPPFGALAPAQSLKLAAQLTGRWLASRLGWLGVRKPYRTVVEAASTPAAMLVRESDEIALARYRPRSYPGKIHFVRAAIPTDFPADAAAVWSPLAKEFELHTAPGDHLGMMTEQFEGLAAAITRCLDSASSQQPGARYAPI